MNNTQETIAEYAAGAKTGVAEAMTIVKRCGDARSSSLQRDRIELLLPEALRYAGNAFKSMRALRHLAGRLGVAVPEEAFTPTLSLYASFEQARSMEARVALLSAPRDLRALQTAFVAAVDALCVALTAAGALEDLDDDERSEVLTDDAEAHAAFIDDSSEMPADTLARMNATLFAEARNAGYAYDS